MREQKKKAEELKARQDDPKVAERKRKQQARNKAKLEKYKKEKVGARKSGSHSCHCIISSSHCRVV